MNPESRLPQHSPESGCGDSVPPTTSDPQSPLITDHRFASGHVRCAPILGTSPSDDMSFDYPPGMLAEPEYESDYDFEEDARERELLMDDLADDNDDFARSEEDGWYYSDEN